MDTAYTNSFKIEENNNFIQKLEDAQNKNNSKNILIVTNPNTNKIEIGHHILTHWGSKSILVEPSESEISFMENKLNNYNSRLNIKETWNEHPFYSQPGRFFTDRYVITTRKYYKFLSQTN